MRPSLRFLAIALIGWTGVRAATLGIVPGAEMFRVDRSEAKAPPAIIATQFPAIDPVQPMAEFPPGSSPYVQPQPVWPAQMPPIVIPVRYATVPPPVRSAAMTQILPEPAPQFYSRIPPLDEWPLSRIASASLPARRSAIAGSGQSVPARIVGIDRVQLTAWALLRGQQGLAFGPSSLASGGSLGGSQAGARLAYNVTRQVALSVRTTTDVGRRGGEVAGGIRIQPVAGIPVWLTAERRQRLGRTSNGRNDFAMFAEAGLYQQSLPWRLQLDAYLQGGVVGLRSRDPFVDGGLTIARPLFGRFSAGLGLWGGAQPGLYRVDAGPRVTMKVRDNLRVHFDWRQRVAGNALPGSGPALTLAGDF